VSQSEIQRLPLETGGLGPKFHVMTVEHPTDRDDTRAGLLKIAALYTMNTYRK
jgi:hypothetical protein